MVSKHVCDEQRPNNNNINTKTAAQHPEPTRGFVDEKDFPIVQTQHDDASRQWMSFAWTRLVWHVTLEEQQYN